MSMFWLQTWGRGERERDCCLPCIPLLLRACVIGMELPTPFFTEGPPLDLIKVSLGYAATLGMNVHLGPFRSRTVALKRKTLLCIGDIHPWSAGFHRG